MTRVSASFLLNSIMRINEITDPSELLATQQGDTVRVPKNTRKLSWPQGSEPARPIGRGGYSSVYDDPNDPHIVIKKERAFTNKHANKFYQWAKAIQKEPSNVYLPRIYKIETEENPSGKTRHTYWIEKLHAVSSQEISSEAILALIDKMFNVSKHDKSELKRMGLHNLWGFIVSKIIHLPYGHKTTSDIKDPELSKAITILKSTGLLNYYDMHDQNLMLRLGPGGPQLVITDPLA